MDVENAPAYSMHNRDKIKPGVLCGCYFCINIFDGGMVKEWKDDGSTALCPACEVDAVLPNVDDTEILINASERWFAFANGD